MKGSQQLFPGMQELLSSPGILFSQEQAFIPVSLGLPVQLAGLWGS